MTTKNSTRNRVGTIISYAIITAVVGGSLVFAGTSLVPLLSVHPGTGTERSVQLRDADEAPTSTPTPTPAPTESLPPALPLDPPPVVEEEPAPPFEPELCPEGTTPGAVDELGNESNCGPADCAAYTDTDGDGIAETCVPYQSRREPGDLGASA